MSGVEIVYPPLDVPKPFASGVFVVDSGPHSAFGIPLPVRMTVLRLGNGDLVLHSPTRVTDDLLVALGTLGRVRHLVAPNSVHFSYVADWQAAVPDAITWAAPGLARVLRVRGKQIRIDRDLGATPSACWAGEIEQAIVPGAGGFREVVFFHRPSRTLVLTDLVVDLEPEKLPGWLRTGARLLGSVGPGSRAPAHLRAIVSLRRGAARAAMDKMLALGPERVIFSHGRLFERDGAARLRASMAWLLG